jgi:hypothetical protein
VADEPSRRRAGFWEFTLAQPVYIQLCDWAISSPTSPLTEVPTFDLRPVCNAHQLEDTPLRESAPTDPLCTIVDFA